MKRPVGADLLLGIDAGTTTMKAAIYAPDGSCLGSGEARQGVISPQPGLAEQDPQSWWRGMVRAARQALKRAGADGEQVSAIGLSTQGGTLAIFDPDGMARGPAIVWSDSRQRDSGRYGCDEREEQFRLTGLAHLDMTPSALGWLRAYCAESFTGKFRIGYVPDYLTFKLTGEWISDSTNLGISNLCDLRTGDIALPVIQRLGLSREVFAATRQAGEAAGALLPTAARALRLRADIPVAVPAHDQYAASLGAGCVEDGDLLLSTGTAWVVLLTTNAPLTDRSSSFWPGRHVERGRWGLLGAISSGSCTLDCLLTLTRQRPDWQRINSAVGAIPAGSDGLLVIPHLVGRTLPTQDSKARGAILGLSLGHTREHLWRAAMEGLAMETRAACEHLAARGARIGALRMVGGAARSPLWPTIIASMLNVPVLACAHENIGVRGAACLAARALGRSDLPETFNWNEHLPVAQWSDSYEQAYERYQRAIERLEESRGRARGDPDASGSRSAHGQ
jgi:xylulokinase